ncbi:MAG: type II toxin-antitoxin system RelE/ParE family toxin, partial [Clostridia bacterium]|nr:type II toxin-antitoxin system RelE/ParE family toxin [Clostridia bacterium]
PLFEEDLNTIVDYISDQLQNPIAARNLVNEVEAAIMKRLPNAESFATYQSLAVHPYPYYYIQIHKYLVFYVVIDDVMEVRRIIYSRRNMTKQF